MSLRNLLFVTFNIIFFSQINAQRNFDGQNYLGLTGGVSIFDINTSDFSTESGTGFVGGFTSRGAFFNDFDLLYGITFSSTQLGIKASNLIDTRFVEYQIQGAQLNILGSYNIIMDHLSVEAGPLLGFNGKMKLKSEAYKDYIVDGYNELRAQDIQQISTFNAYAAAGFTAGIRHIRLTARYHYGINNMLSSLNDDNLENTNFKGNSSNIVVALVAYF